MKYLIKTINTQSRKVETTGCGEEGKMIVFGAYRVSVLQVKKF